MDNEYEYAKQLALYIWAKCYKQESPKWKASPDLMGVLSQISNMVYGMNRSQEKIMAEQLKLFIEMQQTLFDIKTLATKPDLKNDKTETEVRHLLKR